MASDIKIRHILNMLAIQSSKNDQITVENIDQQFINLLKTVERYFQEQEYELLFEWLAELIKKEFELKRKQEENSHIYQKDSINILICKVNLFHARIMEILVHDIDIAYQDYLEMKKNDPEFADSLKLSTLTMANDFISHLTKNRNINEAIFDQYIRMIGQTLNIFAI